MKLTYLLLLSTASCIRLHDTPATPEAATVTPKVAAETESKGAIATPEPAKAAEPAANDPAVAIKKAKLTEGKKEVEPKTVAP
jgi:hypothetical protein